MFIRNNPEIDYDGLEKEVTAIIDNYHALTLNEQYQDKHPDLILDKLQDSTKENNQNGFKNIQELYALQDKAFVLSAFKLLLGRDPTDDELDKYLTLVRQGERKSKIAYLLEYSDEGKKHKSSVSVGKAKFIHKLINLLIPDAIFRKGSL